MKTFHELGLAAPLLQAIQEQGYEHPMPIQEAVIPFLIGQSATHTLPTTADDADTTPQPADEPHQDLIALAQTGTGKTAAYGLPVLHLLAADDKANEREAATRVTPRALILSPTRELCLQIADDLSGFAKNLPDMRILAVYGGANIEPQIRALRHGVDIIVATPGRLIDLKKRGAAVLDNIHYAVLDEADEMLSMGFQEDIDTIFEGLPADHRTLLFSATMSREIERIARNYLHNHKEIQVGSRNEGAENVNHIYYMVHAKDKYLALKRVVDYYPRIYAIIFCRTRMETQEVADNLIRDGYNADALHGDLSQQQRDLTMQKFRKHRTQLLVATDVAARGLDVDDLTHVINFGMPDDVENYTHRSGRTGRAGKKGTSICIVHVREKGKIRQVEKTIQKEFVKGTLPDPKDICTKQLYHVIDDIERVEVDEDEIAQFMPEVTRRWEWLDKEDLIKRIVSREFGRFLQYYANAPEIEDVNDSRSADGSRRDRRKKGDRTAEEGYKRMFITLGKLDGFYAKELIKLINDHVRAKVEIGRIDLMKSYSFVEVAEEHADAVIAAVNGVRIKGRSITIEEASAEGQAPKGERTDSPKIKENRRERRSRERGEEANRGGRRDDRRSYHDDSRDDRKHKRDRNDRPQRPAGKDAGERRKPSREERGYTAPRGRKFAKDDWMKFLHPELNTDLKGEEPDFSEEGWARRFPKKK